MSQTANTLAEIRVMAQDQQNHYGEKCSLWYFELDPKTKRTVDVPRLIKVNALIAYSHLVKPASQRPRMFQTCKTQDEMGSVQTTATFPKYDQNSLSDPSLIRLIEEAGYKKPEPENTLTVQSPVVEKSLDDYTPEELIEYLKNKGAIAGKVKNLLSEPEQTTPETTTEPTTETQTSE